VLSVIEAGQREEHFCSSMECGCNEYAGVFGQVLGRQLSTCSAIVGDTLLRCNFSAAGRIFGKQLP